MSRLFIFRATSALYRPVLTRIVPFSASPSVDRGLTWVSKSKKSMLDGSSFIVRRWLTTSNYESDADETLESLCEKLEALLDSREASDSSDVTLANGVLTLTLEGHGTYVINKQSPNKQIWLSSPVSGPFRFDLDLEKNTWIYRHTGQSLHDLLDREIGQQIFKQDLGFKSCHLGGGEAN